MNIVVTGASGFVGKHLLRELIQNDHNVIALISNDEILTEKIVTKKIDLLNPKELGIIDFKNVDAVIHLAGLAAVGASFESPSLYINSNSSMQINLYEECIKQNVFPKFLIVSSGSVYDSKQKMPISEKTKTMPTSPYAVSKLTQEQLAYYYMNRGFKCIIARPFNHIGPGQNLGFIVADFASQIVKAERGLLDTLKVGNLDAKRDYTDVRDIAYAYRLLVESSKLDNKIVNICSGNSVSGKNILENLLRLSKVKIKIEEDPTKMRPSDIPEIIGSNNLLISKTGWQPKININVTLTDALNDWRQRKA